MSAVLVVLFVEDSELTEQDAEAAHDDMESAVFDHDYENLIDPMFVLGIAFLFVSMGNALLSPLEANINNHIGQGPTMFGIEFSAFLVAQIFLHSPVGSASDRYGRKPFIVGGLIILVPATFAQGFVTTAVGMIGARLVQGAGAAMVLAPGFALAGDLAGKSDSGTTLSVLTMSYTLGTAIGPLIAGYLMSLGYVIPFVFGAGVAALGGFLVSSQVDETITTRSETASGARPARQD